MSGHQEQRDGPGQSDQPDAPDAPVIMTRSRARGQDRSNGLGHGAGNGAAPTARPNGDLAADVGTSRHRPAHSVFDPLPVGERKSAGTMRSEPAEPLGTVGQRAAPESQRP